MRLKVFEATGSEISKLEDTINQWLNSNPSAPIGSTNLAMTQMSPSGVSTPQPYVVVTIWWQEP